MTSYIYDINLLMVNKLQQDIVSPCCDELPNFTKFFVSATTQKYGITLDVLLKRTPFISGSCGTC